MVPDSTDVVGVPILEFGKLNKHGRKHQVNNHHSALLPRLHRYSYQPLRMSHDDTSHRRTRSTSRSRPTTPLRPSSRSSFRDSALNSVQGDAASFPLNTFEPAFAELSDAVADLEANMMHFQLMHESLSRFSESFASFLYGLNMNAFCVDFPEGPMTESFKRMKLKEEQEQQHNAMRVPERSAGDIDTEATFM
ncbi:DASH complex subunit Dam1-domain-containing protein [Chaetomium tenue]|uniref:DASH complex subunit Dam1-domain-containing protein n=1 Tax=Chaetomium tenue TaxID=1854479 RepID=A0ACB7P0V0_9PEZI|nr:DASH complex subunit Dam1-domain-containing protein [Chaetomium globosum]